MTPRERIIAAVNHKDTDFVPYTMGLTQDERAKVAAYTGDEDFMKNLQPHISSAYFGGSNKPVEGKPGYFADDFGVVWNRTVDKDIGIVDGCMLPEPTLENYTFPELDEVKLREGYQRLIDRDDDTFKEAAIGFSMFERAWTLRGMDKLLMDMILNPAFVDELLDAICEYNLKIMDIALEYPFDGFHFGDDWGQQRGLITGPIYWRKFIKPRVARMYQKARDKGLYVSQHSCGDIHEIFPDLIDIGLNTYQTFQPEIYDIESVKAEFGMDLSFWGGISTQQLLPYATVDELKVEVPRIMRIMSKSGGYIASPTHSVPPDVPPENILALIDIFTNQDKYL